MGDLTGGQVPGGRPILEGQVGLAVGPLPPPARHSPDDLRRQRHRVGPSPVPQADRNQERLQRRQRAFEAAVRRDKERREEMDQAPKELGRDAVPTQHLLQGSNG